MKKENTPFFTGFNEVFFWKSGKNISSETSFSESVLAVTGYTAAEINNLNSGKLSLIAEEDFQKVLGIYNDLLISGEKTSASAVYRLMRKDKKKIWVREIIELKRNKNGEQPDINGMVTVVDLFKKEEEDLLQKIDELKNESSAKEKFILKLSHDLRSPFTSILGFAEILIKDNTLSSPERQEYIAYIYNSSESLFKLLSNLLELAKIQVGKTKPEVSKLNVRNLIYNSIASLTGTAARKELEVKADADDSLFISADERLIGIVLYSLISNAIKFSDVSKIIEVTAAPFNKEFTEIIIKDQGVGIPDDKKKRLFKLDDFFSTVGTNGEKGNGLGLLLSREIIEAHGGKIWFYSDTQKGSEFHFIIPSYRALILLVENDPEEKVRCEQIIKEFFPENKLVSSSNAYEAVINLGSLTPELIITSHDLPFMTGPKLLETIFPEERTAYPDLIVLSGSPLDNIKDEYKKFGNSKVLKKPVDPELFCNAVKETVLR